MEASVVFMGKSYSDNLHSIKNMGNIILKQMFEWNSLKLAWKVLHGNSYLWSMMKKSSVSQLCFLRFCVMSWKDESEPNIKYCLRRTAGLVQRFI